MRLYFFNSKRKNKQNFHFEKFLFLTFILGTVFFIGTLKASPVTDTSTSFECKVQPYYKYRQDGKPGRAITLIFKNSKLQGQATITIDCNSVTEKTVVENLEDSSKVEVLLPFNAGVTKECQARISVRTSMNELYRSIMVPVQRQWTVYIYPHSHVDIGYTNTQEFVKKLHMKNIDVAIDIARKTQNYPEGSRFVWNPEASWVTENYLKEASPEKKKVFINAVRKGWICLDGNYFNTNTSACSDEELLRLFHTSNELQKVTGVPINTMVQFDVAGASWGITPAAFQMGIKAFFYYPNLGNIRQPWENRPFYWISPDGKSKILFYQAFPYGFGYTIKGSKIGLYKIQGNDSMLDRIITKDPSADFLDPLIFNETAKLEAANSLYDIFVMPWSLADNSLIDADLPDAVRLWNEKYAFPKLIIAGSQRILNDFESRYQSIIPEVKGDYTEYWTEGLGSDARSVGRVRHATENLVQMETAWCMLNEDKPSPRSLIDSSWKYCLLGVEHTWGYQNPKAPLAKKIEQTKASYFENSLKTSKELLSETFKAVASAGSNKFAVFNTLSWDRGGLITLTKDESKVGDRVLDENGKAVISQRLSTGELVFWAEKIPALGSKVFTIARGKAKKVKGCFIKGNTISNNFFSVTIDPQTGNISSLISLKNGHEYVDKKSAFALNSYLYVLGKDSTEKISEPSDVVLKVKENGPLVASMVAQSKAPGCNWLKREVRVVYNQSWIDLTNSLDKISTRVKEGIHFGFAFNVANGTTRIDIPWGVMIPNYDQLPAANRNWLTFQHWVDISNSKVGVTWTAIESPLLEYGRLSPNLRGWAFRQKYWYKKFEKCQTIFSWALNNYWSTNFPLEQGGIIDLHYAILPHGSYDPVTANRFGMDENRPLIAVPVQKKPLTKSWVRIGNPKVFISILKQSDDGKGMILRLRSVSDRPERVQLTWTNETPRKLYSCLANEKRQNEIKSDRTILPYGTISYYFEM